MDEHPNAVRARRAFDALNERDFETYMDMYADDLVAYVPDPSQRGAAVPVRGRAKFFEMLGKYDELAEGSMHVELETILADDEHVLVFLRGMAQRPEKAQDYRFVTAGRVDAEGRWTELWYLADNQAGHEQFWAE